VQALLFSADLYIDCIVSHKYQMEVKRIWRYIRNKVLHLAFPEGTNSVKEKNQVADASVSMLF
jgi:hypothetical protein